MPVVSVLALVVDAIADLLLEEDGTWMNEASFAMLCQEGFVVASVSMECLGVSVRLSLTCNRCTEQLYLLQSVLEEGRSSSRGPIVLVHITMDNEKGRHKEVGFVLFTGRLFFGDNAAVVDRMLIVGSPRLHFVQTS